MHIQTIPLNQLVHSPANVRKTGLKIGIEELAASIRAHGLLQNLQVRPASSRKFEVVAGGRRLAALKLLAKQKSVAKDAGIECHILDAEDVSEISLAENTVRSSMHPADQFAAFSALADTGKGPEEIAARFGVSAAVVKQRLKLASVSPSLIKVYRQDEMSLDQLMAFTVSDDHGAQEAAWLDQPDWQRKPNAIRRTLTSAHVDADDLSVRFVGIEAYKAAGGGILRDLFEPEHEGYLTDTALLNRLVIERLEGEAETIRLEGWAWVEIIPRLDYDALHDYGRVQPEAIPLPAEQQAELNRLTAEYEAIVDANEELEPDLSAQVDALSDKIDALYDQAAAWRPEDLALAGTIVSVGNDGKIRIERGLVRPDDRKAHLRLVRSGVDGEDNATAKGEQASPLSARLIEDLTAERTAALRAMMQDNESVALASIAHALALAVFFPYGGEAESCLDLRLASRDLRRSADSFAESGAGILLAVRESAWRQQLPETAGELFDWLLKQETTTITRLIAFCGAMSIDAVKGKQDRANCPRLAHANALAG